MSGEAEKQAAENPRIRPVEAYPVDVEGQRMVVLRDGTGLSENQIVLSPAAFFIVTLLDGTRTLLDVRHEYARKFGELLFSDQLEELIEKLDHALLLDSPRFRDHARSLETAFAALPERPCKLDGRAYDSDPAELAKWLDAIVDCAGGQNKPAHECIAIIAPHIDIARAAFAYGAAWKAASAGAKPDRVVILGTSHFGHSDSLFIATKKPFRTPLGSSPVDQEVLAEIEAAAGPGIFDGEYAHSGEHSVEFQVLFTQRLFGPDTPIVPILACSLHEFLGGETRPSQDARISSVAGVLGRLLTGGMGRTLIVASADLAHVGLRFGDSRPADEAFLAPVESNDRELLDRACDADAEGFFDVIARNRDATRICGYPSILALLLALKGTGAKGTLLEYGKMADETGSAVTFAGVTFEAERQATRFG